MAVSLLTKLDEENGGTGAPTVVTPGLRWLFKGFVGLSGGALSSGQFKVNGGALTTYNIGSVIGSNDNPSIDISLSPIGTYLFEYNIEECDFGSTLSVTNVGCPTCNTGSAVPLSVCNASSCTVNLFDHLTGGPDTGGSWAHVSGPQTLTFTNGDDGTVNFSGKAAGTYVARYTKLTCTTDVTITVTAPPNAGTNNVVLQKCDASNEIVNFENVVGGLPGTWVITTALPQYGVVDLANKRYTTANGDGGNTYATPIRYTFVKTVMTTGLLDECTGCNSSVTLHVDVYPKFFPGQNSTNNVICNDGSQRELRDLLNGEDDGGRWDFLLYQSPNPPPFGSTSYQADLIINGSNAPGYVGTGTNYLFNGDDHGTIGFIAGAPAGNYTFRYKRPNQNEICSSIALVTFNVQQCIASCTTNNPTINKNVSGNCVNATRGGSVTALQYENWSYRLSSNGTWVNYSAGSNICGQPYVEFRFVLIFSNGCPNIEKTIIHNVPNTTCSNTPTVSGSFGSCQFTLTPGGSIGSPVASSILQWRYQGDTTWLTYTGPIAVTGPATIEYRRVVTYTDGCSQTTTSTGTVSGQCAQACSVTGSINSNNNVLLANASGCGSSGISYDWRYSSNGSSYGSSIGGSSSLTPTADGYYKVIMTCGTCTAQDIIHWIATPTLPPTCAGSMSMSFANNTITANRVGCTGSISYDWRFSPTGTGWSVVSNNANSPNLIPIDGPGFYRVFSLCNGACLFTGDYQVTGTTCNSAPTVSCSYNTGTCLFTLTPGGNVTCEIAQDSMYWRPAGSLIIHEYSVPFAYAGAIEVQRYLNCFGDCPDINTPWTACNGGTCCNGNSIDVTASFNQGACQFTLTPVTNVTSTIIADVIHWRIQGTSTWNNYTGPFSSSGVVEYERIVTFQGSCGNITTGIKTISGSCCTGNNPTVSGSYNQNTCQYTITAGGTNSSTIVTDILEWRQTGSSGSYTTYNGAFNGPSSIEIRRRVTYSDGCTATVPGSASGNCCVGNNPSASCAFDNNACLFTLTPIGTVSSPTSSDIIRWRGQGSSVWITYTGPFANNGVVEFQREVIFSNGCTTIITPILTCNGLCCGNNTPDVTHTFNGSDCKYTLIRTGTLVNTINTDVVEYRDQGSSTWLVYTVPFTGAATIEYRRTVTFIGGCTQVQTGIKTGTGTCCLGNSPTVSCGFVTSTCTYTLTPGGSIASPILASTIYWRQVGATVWQVYSGPFVQNTNIEYYRHVTFTNSCSPADTAIQTCTGICCANNSPDVTYSFNGSDCKYTLTRTGTLVNTVSSDVLEYRNQGSGTWLTYSVPTTAGPIIEYRRVVTFSDGCTTITTATHIGNGSCCVGNSPTVGCGYNATTCTFTLTPGGTVSSPVASSTIYWRPVGSSTWQVYSGPFVQQTNIEYYRHIIFSNGCSPADTAVQTCSGSCCINNNNPDVIGEFNSTTCSFELTRIGNVSNVNTDVVQYSYVANGPSVWQTYTAPVPYGAPGNSLQYRRIVTFTNGCPAVNSDEKWVVGTCCSSRVVGLDVSVNPTTCEITITPTGVTGHGATEIYISWAPEPGVFFEDYTGPFTHSGPIEVYLSVTFLSDNCTAEYQTTYTGVCCSENNPDVTCAKNAATCTYTLTPTGTNTSPVATDIIEWRAQGGSTFTAYSGPFVFSGNIEYRRRVTYSNGCSGVTTSTHSCSGNCCTTNTPDVQCSFNSANCQLTLSNTGTNASTPATDVKQYRAIGSSTWLTYSSPVVVTGGIEYRRVVTYSDGCATITTATHTCGGTCCINDNPDVGCSKNSATCIYTLTPNGTNTSPVLTDIVEWRVQGGTTFTQYTGPFYFPGTIEYRRRVTYSNGCDAITTATHTCSGLCCTTNLPDVQCSFNSSDCKFTLTSTGTNTSGISSDVIQYRAIGASTWLTYSVPVAVSAGIEYRRTVTYSDGCATITTSIKTCNGLCCLGNSPTVSCNYNTSTCLFTLTPGGSFTSPVATSVIYWRQGTSGTYQLYSGPVSYIGSIQYYRVVTFSDGCATITTAVQSCSGICCTTNQPDATCSFNPANCQFTLTNSGTVTSAIATDKIEYRTLGSSGSFTQYTIPIVNPGGLEYRRVITFSDGCSGITTNIKTCNGVCCLGSTPEVTGSYNTSTCQFTLTPIGTNASTPATDVIEWRPQGTTNWTVYNGVTNYVGAIEYRRTVTYSNGCQTIVSIIHSLTGVCCTTNNPTISCAFDSQTCKYTLTKGGTSTSPITSDIVYWRPLAGGAYNVYSAAFTQVGQIEYYRQVIYSDSCAMKTTAVQTCNGACCGSNTPGVSVSFNPADCKYTITRTGTNVSTVVTDVLQWRDAGLGGSWNTYSVPFTGPELIEVQRLVTYSDSCVANPTATGAGTCCLGNSPDATCAYDNVTCLYTLTKTGTNTSPVSSDIIRWRPQGTTPWNTYNGPFANTGQIEYQRFVNYANACPQGISAIHTCNGTCCNGNTPDVQCAFNPADCKYTLNRIGSNVGTVNTDVVQYRLAGSSGSWTTYTVPFTFTGGIEYQRIVTYSNGCTTVTTAIHACAGDCCTTLAVSTSINGSNNLVASVTGCTGTATVNWYYGTTQGNTTTFLGSGTTISPSFGSGWYEARVNCTNGCIASSKIQFACASSASLNTSLSTLTVTGLTSCPSPSYVWQYSVNGSTGWATASGATNSASLTMANGNGWYRVNISCNGICPITLSYQRDCNCSNTAVSVVAVKTSDFVVTATPSGCGGSPTYTWTATPGGSIVSGQGTNQITTNGYGTYSVQMTCNNSCGTACSSVSNSITLCICQLSGGTIIEDFPLRLNITGLTGCTGTLTYLWTASNGGSIDGSTTSSVLNVILEGTFTVVVTCSDCTAPLCQVTRSFTYQPRPCVSFNQNGAAASVQDLHCFIQSTHSFCIRTNTIAVNIHETATDIQIISYKLRYSTENFDRDVTSFASLYSVITNVGSKNVTVRATPTPFAIVDNSYILDNGQSGSTNEINTLILRYKVGNDCYLVTVSGGGRLSNESQGSCLSCS